MQRAHRDPDVAGPDLGQSIPNPRGRRATAVTKQTERERYQLIYYLTDPPDNPFYRVFPGGRRARRYFCHVHAILSLLDGEIFRGEKLYECLPYRGVDRCYYRLMSQLNVEQLVLSSFRWRLL